MARMVAGLPKGTRISDSVTLGVLTTTVPASLIDAVLEDTGCQSVQQRSLPARLVVYCIFRLNPPSDFGGKRPPVSVQTALPFR